MADVQDNSDMSIIQTIPALPAGKSRHFFVSYSCEERDKVIECIDELERRFPVKCLYSDRDFQPGKDIAVNIKEALAMSIKVLLFVSPSFLQSGWCKYETDAAFVESMGCGYSCIVPVLLEECEVPPTLVTLTYIDATIPGVDIPAKIASSLIQPNTDDGILGLNMQSWNKIYENGYCFTINAEREPLSSVRPAKYIFSPKQSDFDYMRLYKMQVPSRLLKNAFRVINDSQVMRRFDYRSVCKTFWWMILLLVPLIVLLMELSNKIAELVRAIRISTDRQTQALFSGNDVEVPIVFAFFLAAISAVIIPKIQRSKKGDIILQTKLWKSVGEQCIENNILLLFSTTLGISPTEYLVGVIQSKNLSCINDEMTAEEFAKKLIKEHLAEATKTIGDNFWSLPDAPAKRHNVKGGKMCICQQLERELNKTHQ